MNSIEKKIKENLLFLLEKLSSDVPLASTLTPYRPFAVKPRKYAE